MAVQENDNQLIIQDQNSAKYFVDGGLTLSNNAAITLQAGDYYLSHLKLRNNASVAVQPDAVVRLFIDGKVELGNNAAFNVPIKSGSHIEFIIRSDDAIVFNNNSDSALSIYAPGNDITMENNATMYGTVVGKKVEMYNNGMLLAPAADMFSLDDNQAPQLTFTKPAETYTNKTSVDIAVTYSDDTQIRIDTFTMELNGDAISDLQVQAT